MSGSTAIPATPFPFAASDHRRPAAISRLIPPPPRPTLFNEMKILPILLMELILASGCAHTGPVLLCQASVENHTPRDLHNFRIIHHPTERILSSNQILAGKDIGLGVPHPELKATSATLTWEDPMWGHRQVEVQIPPPEGTARLKQLIYSIGPSGLVDVRLVPCE